MKLKSNNKKHLKQFLNCRRKLHRKNDFDIYSYLKYFIDKNINNNKMTENKQDYVLYRPKNNA